jgi:hypothetical protein
MNLIRLLSGPRQWLGGRRVDSKAGAVVPPEPGLFGTKRPSPFATTEAASEAVPRPPELRLGPSATGLTATTEPRRVRRLKRTWFGWLLGRNRRRDLNGSLVQGELLLTQVRPVRNDFRDDDAGSGAARARSKVLHETPLIPERRDDQDHAWNRLRNRRVSPHVVGGD